MTSIPIKERSKEFKELNLDREELSVERALGIV